MREALRALPRARVPLRGLAEAPRSRFEVLAEEAEVLAERAARAGEDLVSVIEMHLNVVSYQMNRVMRLLAVVTTLALFPTVVGGLLGMNLAASPWRPSLAQVAFGVGSGMALALYAFAVKGWLR